MIYGNKNKHFNLPKGEYFLSEKPTLTQIFNYKYDPLIFGEIEELKKRFSIRFVKNNNGATIYKNNGLIIVDSKYKNNIPLMDFIIAHELAHTKFKNKKHDPKIERKCDKIARDYMLGKGWNDSQVYAFAYHCLTDKSRVKEIFDL
jgi:hypothetical protein